MASRLCMIVKRVALACRVETRGRCYGVSPAGRLTYLGCACILLITLGCVHHRFTMTVPTVKHVVSPFQLYLAKNFDWSTVHRVLLMPVANQSAFPNATQEIQVNLATELQRAGYFEIVVAQVDDPGVRARDVFASGQFNEIEVVRAAREYQADAILFVNVTQYHAYKPPRMGLSLLLVSPAEGIAIASLSGLWDAREPDTLELAQAYLRQNQNWPRSLMAQDRVVEMPDVYQRFVCHQVAESFHPPGPQIVATPVSTNIDPGAPVEGTMSIEAPLAPATILPPMPPPSEEILQP